MFKRNITDLNLNSITSISQLIRLRVEKSPNDNAFSHWKFNHSSEVDHKLQEPNLHTDNWQQFYQRFKYISSFLLSANFNKVGIFLPASYAWILSDAACLEIGATSFMYHNAWQEIDLCHAVKLENPDVIICCDYLVHTLQNSLLQLGLKLPIILVDVPETYFFEKNQCNECNNITHCDNNITKIDIFSENIFLSELEINLEQDLNKSGLSHTAAFTSGTGGNAKGVLLSQYSLLKTAVEAYQTLGFNAMDSTMFHWMPLSHVFGRIGLYIAVIIKAHSYFSRGVNYFIPDIKMVKPSILFAVPKVVTRLKTQIKHSINKKPVFTQKLIHIFEKLGNIWQKLPYKLPMYMHNLQKKLFKPLHEQLGGNLKLLVVGGAPVCKIQKQYFESLGIRVCEGFGMTETAGVVSVQPYYKKNQGCGKILPSVKVSFSEQGELLLSGDTLLKEYIKNDEKTKPWFNTGDVAKIAHNEYLHIIGRTKEIIITENGENIHPNKIEELITQHKYIEDVCLVGDNQTSLLALLNIDSRFIDAQDLHQQIKQHLRDININLPRFERVHHYIIVPAFLQNGLLTVTHKKKRQAIYAYYKTQIEEYYS